LSLELRHLRCFIAVAEEKHFGRAAERLRVAQPSVSQQIKALERSVGVRLVLRDQRHVELTPAGEKFLEHARLVVELSERAVESARLAGKEKEGLIRVGTSISGIHPVANALLREFHARFPNVEVEVHPGYVPANLEALTRRALDVAVVLVPFDATNSPRYLRLGTTELLVALPQAHRLASLDRIPPSELLKEPFLEWPRNVNPQLADHLHHLLFGEVEHPRPVEVADVLEASRLLLVAEGKGFSVPILTSLAELRIPGVAFRRFTEPAPILEYGVAWFDTHASPFVESFMQVAREVADSANEGAAGQND
jgi:DNA-binding transcriptional LysR family regulator